MKVYYLAPQKDFSLHRDNYAHAISILLKDEAKIVNEWFVNYERKDADDSYIEDSSKYYQEAMQQIASSDLVIFDATVSSMSIGHQMTYSLYLQKPTLLLLNGKYKKPKDLFIAGSESQLLTVLVYENKKELEERLKKYLADNKLNKKNRLNLALDKAQHEYLVWASFNYNKTKTKIVKQAIDKMKENDEEYKESKNSKV